jgi:hypothetical protein
MIKTGDCRLIPRLAWCATVLLTAFTVGAAPADSDLTLGHGSHQLTLSSNGALVSFCGHSAANPNSAAGEIRCAGKSLPLESPEIARHGNDLVLTYHLPGEPACNITVTHSLTNSHGAFAWIRQITISCPMKLDHDLTVSIQAWTEPFPAQTWLPRIDGTGATLGTNLSAEFRFAGAVPENGVPLALPMISIPTANPKTRILLATDPYFSAHFISNSIEWTYPAKAGLPFINDQRTVVVALRKGSVDDALADFFRLLLPEVAPGPEWLHEIALVDFDYMSDGGNGWFRDIDALSGAIPRHSRHQAFLCLHGWYDFLGRYCFDDQTKKFDRDWTVFSNYENARHAHPFGTIGGDKVPMGFENCKPVKMSLPEVHRRLQYARDRGFRVGMYFADGLNAADGLPGFNPDRVLYWGGWQGPDSKGKSYIQNPLNPDVNRFFADYTRALLNEFGADIDALVWDETFHVRCGQLGTNAWPGYADRAMMLLVQKVTAEVDDYNRAHHRHIALLTSDCLGTPFAGGPYALAGYGTYQDSWCNPHAWSYGIFPNYRNVLWSCCWWPISKWSWIDFAVRNYQSPVSLSNGWGDDTGFSEITPAQQARVIELFNWRRKFSTKLKWFDHLPAEPGASPSESR